MTFKDPKKFDFIHENLKLTNHLIGPILFPIDETEKIRFHTLELNYEGKG